MNINSSAGKLIPLQEQRTWESFKFLKSVLCYQN